MDRSLLVSIVRVVGWAAAAILASVAAGALVSIGLPVDSAAGVDPLLVVLAVLCGALSVVLYRMLARAG